MAWSMEEEALALSHAASMPARASSSLEQGKPCGLGNMGERVEPREIRQRVDLAEPVGKF